MMLSFGEDGTLHKVDEEKTVLVDEEELDMLVNKVNEQEVRIIQLEAQLYCTAEGGVCEICKHMYLEEHNDDVVLGKYYVSRCKKGYDKCSKDTLKHCEDFELKNDGDVE